MFGMHVYEMIWHNFSNMFKWYVILFILIYYHWNRRTFNLAKATGSYSSSSGDIIFYFICLHHAVIGALHSSSPVRLPLRMQWWIQAIWFGLYLCRWLSLFILLRSSRLFTQMVIFSSALSLPLPFFLSLSMSQNKNNFQGRQRNRSRWQKIRMTAALAMWLIFQSFSLFSSW